ncbi:TetR/AcrR family transcriptional regulator [Gordonia sp. PDNC005]|uniref:TetR/AcrR family transcriptional regulator n=1 Tax=unclassified Gordonia (in: high G+C Gram-positive bacteria) TaxID=2657482 RepID=UPI00196380DD|nr:TetR/AcrR family transcriptional regulator [Gordonia sp. PDNC005]QRY63039.1 TetR/AcrR family transcriptional regulator [Gordonia sp. PDNC005]
MGRPKKFDPDAATDAAVDVFWSRGYADATPAALEAGMGIARSSLYNTFGSKSDLYLRALERYIRDESSQVIELLDQPGDVLPKLRAAIERVVDLSLLDAERRGCMVTNAAIERARDDEQVRTLLAQVVDDQVAAFSRAIAHGQVTGEINPAVDSTSMGNLLVATVNGIRVLARVDPSPTRLAALADAALLGL